jgi:hypothetical protein
MNLEEFFSFSDILKIVCEKDDLYLEALDLERANSHPGRIWLIGSFVYKTLANHLYGSAKPVKDFDFIVEHPRAFLNLPSFDWFLTQNRFGNPKIESKTNETKIDFVPLDNVFSITKRGPSPTIENYLTGTPLNIQAIAYDVDSHSLSGYMGIESIKHKIVRVNDFEMAEKAAIMYGVALNKIIKNKADDLGFKAELV